MLLISRSNLTILVFLIVIIRRAKQIYHFRERRLKVGTGVRIWACKQKQPCRGILAYFDVYRWLWRGWGVEVISFLQTFKMLCLLVLLLLLLLPLTRYANILELADKGNPGNTVFEYTRAPPTHPATHDTTKA